MRAGKKTPYAQIMISPWGSLLIISVKARSGKNLIFILEDDAQNGPDHVDAHRSHAYLISPYVKRKSEHTSCIPQRE
jgi:hypothetical protein